MKHEIVVLIQAYNQEKNIEECIKSAEKLTKNIVVVDLQSTDMTKSLAIKNGARIYEFTHTDYVELARTYGIEKSAGEWVFILDPDERITDKLSSEVRQKISSNNYTHYKIPRKNYAFRVKWLRYGGWTPDHVIRLINKKYFKGWPKKIHSTPIIDGDCGYLVNSIIHYWRDRLEDAVKSTIIFEGAESDLLLKAGKNVNTLTFFRKFIGELWRRLVKNLGFLDGSIGIIESVYQAFSKTITYLFLYEKRKKSSDSEDRSL